MNITLVRPPAYSAGLMGAQLVPYLGISYIAASIRAKGYSVDVVDMCGEDISRVEIVREKYVMYGMAFSALKGRLRQADIFAVTCMFSQDWVFHRDLIKYVRGLYPESVIVAGGEHVSALPQYCLEDCPELDICVVGEAEEIMVKLIEAIERQGDLSIVDGLVYRCRDKGVIVSNRRGSRIKDIDMIPLPAWDLTPMENYLSRGLTYHIRRGRTIPMLATRGCPYKCTFCSNSNMWSNPWLPRNPKLVVDEIELYIKHYKADNFVFSDLTSVVDKKNIVSLCGEILSRKINITWQLPTLRTEAIDFDILRLMYNAGCRELDFAVESASKKVLISVDKRNNPEKMSSLIRKGLQAGINFSINIVLGLPAEGLNDFLKTYLLLMRLAVAGLQEVNIFPFIPYPGSQLFREFILNKEIILTDNYFLSLFGYADLGRAISWSHKFGPRTLSFMRLFLFINFYAVMFISHPSRLVSFIANIVKGRPSTKLEGVLGRVFKNVKVYFPVKKLTPG